MSISSLNEAFNLIEKSKEKADFEGEKPESLIKSAESALGLKVPPTYKKFLKKYGCGDINGFEFFGLIHENFEQSGEPDFVWTTINARRKWHLPHHFIIIGDTGDGDWYALDSSQPNSEGEYPVVICCYDGDTYHTEKIHADFGEFLLTETQFALKEDEDDEEE
jgi:hypothetical protein